jgi:hypothetical protein
MPKKLTVLIKDELDEQFRNAVFQCKGMRKGNITEAVQEAMLMWINLSKKSEVKNNKQ